MRFVASSMYVPSLRLNGGQLPHLHFQTELATSTETSSPDADHGVPDIRSATDPFITTPNVDHNVLEDQEDADDQNRAVGDTCTMPVTE